MGISTTSTNANTSTQDMGTNQGQQGGASRVGSPISNDAYNVITALQSKLEGLEAYRKYSQDPNGGIWQTLMQTEIASVGTLVDELERLVKDGKFRMKTPGGGAA